MRLWAWLLIPLTSSLFLSVIRYNHLVWIKSLCEESMCDDTKVKAVHCFKLSSLLSFFNHPLHFLQHEMLDDIYDKGNPIIWVFSPHESQVPLPALGTCGEFCIPFSSTVEMACQVPVPALGTCVKFCIFSSALKKSDEVVIMTAELLNLKPLFVCNKLS